jgi:hypothetical protein
MGSSGGVDARQVFALDRLQGFDLLMIDLYSF